MRFPADTTSEAFATQVTIWRTMTFAERAATIRALDRSVRTLTMAGIRSRHPEASEAEHRRLYAEIVLGPELASRVYGDR